MTGGEGDAVDERRTHTATASATGASDPALSGALAKARVPLDPAGAAVARDRVAAALFGGAATASGLGRFRVLDRLGAGGMGVVYSAYDPDLDRGVALKLVRVAARGRDAAVAEARALARLSHPNVVPVHDVGVVEGHVYIVMELIRGETLRRWVRQRPRDRREIVAAHLQAGEALAAAHAAGLVHRDFKPDNAIVGSDGRVRVVDFGLACEAADASGADEPAPREVAGTPRYMAPEQAAGRPVTAAADQFAFCVSLYEALHGDAPQVASAPPWLREILLRGMAPDPSERWPSMRALLHALGHDPAATRRRRATVAGVVVLAGLATWDLLHGESHAAELCGNATAHLARAWDAPVRAQVAAAFLATGRPYAAMTFAQTARQLDGYARDWASMYTASCRATRITGEQSEAALDLRTTCLDRRRRELAALSGVFASGPDEEVLDHAVQAATELGTLDACADVPALARRVPPVRDAAQARAADALRDRLVDIEAQERAGKLRPALALAGPAADDADRVGYLPLQAQAYGELGRLRAELDDAAGAVTAFDRAVELSAKVEDDSLVAQTVVSYAVATADQAGRFEEALRWAAFGRAFAERVDDELSIAKADLASARALERLSRFREAVALAEAALAIYERRLGREHPYLVEPLRQLSQLLRGEDRLADARALALRALDICVRAHGEVHPETANQLDALALIASQQRRSTETRDYAERALAIREQVYGPESASVGRALTTLSWYTADPSRRADLRERALPILERTLGPEHPEVAAALGNLGEVRVAQRRFDEADQLLRRALAIQVKVFGPDDAKVAPTYRRLGELARRTGHRAEGEKYLRASLAAYAKVARDGTQEFASAEFTLGTLLVEDERCADARPYLEEALSIYEKAFGHDSPYLNDHLRLLATCDVEQGHHADAVARIDRALRNLGQGRMGGMHEGRLRAVLARALWGQATDRRRALSEARKAEAILRKAAPLAASDLRALLRWRAKIGR